jgi:NAD-dependent deacetylase
MSTRLDEKVFHKAADLMREARHAIALTGAGSSTSSGIPDFRTAESGLWTRFQPMEVASLSAFRRQPEDFFEWLRPLACKMRSAQPNPAHLALADLEQRGHIQAIITQNFDGLHQRAGSKQVIEVHGSMKSMTCIGCYRQYEAEDLIEGYIDEGTIPRCKACNKILKPDVVLFEEQLPATTWVEARQQASACDLMIVAGSSLVVMPVAGLPMTALKSEAQVIVINKSSTYIDDRAAAVLTGDVADIIPALRAEIFND